MKDINQIILVGRLGADPIQRATKNGIAVVHFPLATSRRLPEGQEGQPEAQWHKIVVWGKQGQACAQYLRKGDPVFVSGTVKSGKYQDKEGVQRVSFEVHAEDVSFLGKSASAPVAEAV